MAVSRRGAANKIISAVVVVDVVLAVAGCSGGLVKTAKQNRGSTRVVPDNALRAAEQATRWQSRWKLFLLSRAD